MKEGGRLVSRVYRRATERKILPVADPYVAHRPDTDTFVLFQTRYTRLALRESPTLDGLVKAEETTIFEPGRSERFNQGLWAPEGHLLQDEEGNDRWYIPVAIHDGDSRKIGPVVLESKDLDPHGPYVVKNQLTPGAWGIDQTYLRHDGQLFAIWSGWNSPDEAFPQNLYIAPMENPWTLIAKEAQRIATPEYAWEMNGAPVNEGPQVRQTNGRTQIIFSASGSWTTDYVMGAIDLVGDDVMDPASWKKRPSPIHKTNRGHGHTIHNEHGVEVMVSGAKLFDAPGWERKTVMEPASATSIDRMPETATETEVVVLKPKLLQVAGFTSPSKVAV